MINFWIGHTPTYEVASKICEYSLSKQGISVKKHPLYYESNTGNPFTRTRFLTPIMDSIYSDNEWVFFSDDDFLFLKNPMDLVSKLDSSKIVYVCKHPEYLSRVDIKLDGKKQMNYPKKNWSSFMIFNKRKCNLTFEKVFTMSLKELHQFEWCSENKIGEIPLEWNWLVGDYEDREDVNALHYTLGGPWYPEPFESKLNSIWIDFQKQFEDTQ